MNPGIFTNKARIYEPRSVSLWLGVLLGSVFFGLLATTANPLMIGLVVSLVGGAFLLAKPQIAVWVILILGLAMGAFISLAGPTFFKLYWAISMLAFLLMVPAFLYLPRQKNLPVFFWLALAFMLVSVGSSLVQGYSAAEFFAGFKRYFQAYGLLMALAVLPFTLTDFTRWRMLLLVVGLLQVPFALFEFFVLIPMRGGLSGGASSTDVVAGTFGANLEGGSANAEMAAFLLIVIAFLFSRWKQKLLSTRVLILLGLPCFATLFLGEVKIVLVMLPIIMLIIVREDVVRRPAFFLTAVVVTGIGTFFIGYVYANFYLQGPLWKIFSKTLAYNFYNIGYGTNFLNRTTVLSFWWVQQGFHDPVGFFFGHGLGSSFSSPQTVVPGHIAAKWAHYGIGLTTASSLLWDTGVVGFLLFLCMLLWAWHACNILRREATEPWVRSDAMAIQSAIAMFLIYLIYSKTLVTFLPFEIIMAVILGYLAYLHNKHRTRVFHAKA
jgi:hypothetical protein